MEFIDGCVVKIVGVNVEIEVGMSVGDSEVDGVGVEDSEIEGEELGAHVGSLVGIFDGLVAI